MMDLLIVIAYLLTVVLVSQKKRFALMICGSGFALVSIMAGVLLSLKTAYWLDHLIISLTVLFWANLVYRMTDNRDAVVVISGFAIFQALASFDGYVLPFQHTFLSDNIVLISLTFNILIFMAALGNGNLIRSVDRYDNNPRNYPNKKSSEPC